MMSFPTSLLGYHQTKHQIPQDVTQSNKFSYTVFQTVGCQQYIQLVLPHLAAPWKLFHHIQWTTNDLPKILSEIKRVCRKAEIRAFTNNSISDNVFEDDDQRVCILFLCGVMTGIASIWDELVDMSTEINEAFIIDQNIMLHPFNEQQTQHTDNIQQNSNQLLYNPDHQTFPLHKAINKDPLYCQQEDLQNPKDFIETIIKTCISYIVEILSTLVINSNYVLLVLEHSNQGLLFFEALGIPDRNIQYDTLLLIQRLLCEGKLSNRTFLPNEFNFNNNKIVEQALNQSSMQIANALVRAPQSIGNMMIIFEDNDVAAFIKNQCLNVFLLLTHLSEDIRMITTFQSLPELLIDSLLSEILDNDVILKESDISAVGLDCLNCIGNLFLTVASQKYFHETGLINKLLDALSLLLRGRLYNPETLNNNEEKIRLPQYFQTLSRLDVTQIIPKGLNAILSILRLFLLGAQLTPCHQSSDVNPIITQQVAIDDALFLSRRKILSSSTVAHLLTMTVRFSSLKLGMITRSTIQNAQSIEKDEQGFLLSSCKKYSDTDRCRVYKSLFSVSIDILLLVFYDNDTAVYSLLRDIEIPSISVQVDCPELSTDIGLGVESKSTVRLFGPIHDLSRIIFSNTRGSRERFILEELFRAIISQSRSMQERLLATFTPEIEDTFGPLILGKTIGQTIVYIFLCFLRGRQDFVSYFSCKNDLVLPSTTGHDDALTLETITMHHTTSLDSLVHEYLWLAIQLLIHIIHNNPEAKEMALEIPVTLPEDHLPCETLSDIVLSLFGKLANRLTLSSQQDTHHFYHDNHAEQQIQTTPITYSMSLLSSLSGILQLLYIWLENNPFAVTRCINNVSFIPTLFNLIGFADSEEDLQQVHLITSVSYESVIVWRTIIQGLSVSLLVGLLRSIQSSSDALSNDSMKTPHLSQLPHNTLPISQVMAIIQHRFSLDKITKKFNSLLRLETFTQHLKMQLYTEINETGDSSGFQISSLIQSVYSNNIHQRSNRFHLFYPTLCKSLYVFRNQFQPFLVHLFLHSQTTHLSESVSQFNTQDAVTHHSVIDSSCHPNDSRMTTEIIEQLKSLIKSQEIELDAVRKEKDHLLITVERLHRQDMFKDEKIIDELTQQRQILLKEVTLLRQEVHHLLMNQSKQQQNWSCQRYDYELKLKTLKNQLWGVVQAYDQLEQKHQASLDRDNMTHDVLKGQTNSILGSNYQILLEILGYLSETFPDVSTFFQSLDINLQQIEAIGDTVSYSSNIREQLYHALDKHHISHNTGSVTQQQFNEESDQNQLINHVINSNHLLSRHETSPSSVVFNHLNNITDTIEKETLFNSSSIQHSDSHLINPLQQKNIDSQTTQTVPLNVSVTDSPLFNSSFPTRTTHSQFNKITDEQIPRMIFSSTQHESQPTSTNEAHHGTKNISSFSFVSNILPTIPDDPVRKTTTVQTSFDPIEIITQDHVNNEDTIQSQLHLIHVNQNIGNKDIACPDTFLQTIPLTSLTPQDIPSEMDSLSIHHSGHQDITNAYLNTIKNQHGSYYNQSPNDLITQNISLQQSSSVDSLSNTSYYRIK